MSQNAVDFLEFVKNVARKGKYSGETMELIVRFSALLGAVIEFEAPSATSRFDDLCFVADYLDEFTNELRKNTRGGEVNRPFSIPFWHDIAKPFWDGVSDDCKIPPLLPFSDVFWHFCCIIDITHARLDQDLFDSECVKLLRDCVRLKETLAIEIKSQASKNATEA